MITLGLTKKLLVFATPNILANYSLEACVNVVIRTNSYVRVAWICERRSPLFGLVGCNQNDNTNNTIINNSNMNNQLQQIKINLHPHGNGS